MVPPRTLGISVALATREPYETVSLTQRLPPFGSSTNVRSKSAVYGLIVLIAKPSAKRAQKERKRERCVLSVSSKTCESRSTEMGMSRALPKGQVEMPHTPLQTVWHMKVIPLTMVSARSAANETT